MNMMTEPLTPARLLQPVTDFDGARSAPTPQDRLRALRRAGEQFRERFLGEPAVRYARSFDLLRIPYPAWYAFNGVYAQQLLKPHMVHLLARTVLVQFEDFEGQLKHLLFTPADFETGSETPYFKRLSEQTPKFLHGVIAPVHGTVLQALASVGVAPEQIDFITYDHLHTQDLRRWLGTGAERGLLPNARLLVRWPAWQACCPRRPTGTALRGCRAWRPNASCPSMAACSWDAASRWCTRRAIPRATTRWSTAPRMASV